MLERLRLVKVVIFTLVRIKNFRVVAWFKTIHAEQSAISHAWLRNESRITDIVVNYTPCGHRRQFMNELYQRKI